MQSARDCAGLCAGFRREKLGGFFLIDVYFISTALLSLAAPLTRSVMRHKLIVETNVAEFNAIGTIASLTPTVAHLFTTRPPHLSSEPPLIPVVDGQKRLFGDDPIERCIVFCPDALGAHIWQVCGEHIQTITDHANLRVPLSSVVPPKTPVCFASMFTGGQPLDHGIRKYQRPILTCDTLFDVLLRVGKNVAIIAIADSSIDLIFRDRDIDYFSESDDRSVARRTVEVMKQNRHHCVIAYQQEYDDLLHDTEPFSEACIQAVNNHISSFTEIARTALEVWRDDNYAIVFAPDHGSHLNPNTGHGDHGDDIPQDMDVFHWYGLNVRQPNAA